ncbi:D-2-hydroxyacid dehydrogenase, partial [Streptomyces sp. DT225]
AARGDVFWRLPRTVVTSHSAGITADEDIVTDFTACLRELSAGRAPGLTVDTGRGY